MLPVFASSKFFAFHAELNGKYLQSVYRRNASGSLIEASAATVVANARTRFLVERPEEGGGLMHVRCCYNNKYWVPVQVQDSGSSRWIIGTADEREEDLSSPSCTLFHALLVKDNSIRFLHSGLRKSAYVVLDGDKPCLELRDDTEDQESNSVIFGVVGLPPQKELPKYVAFKGDNGKYLATKKVLATGMKTFAQVVDTLYLGKYLIPGMSEVKVNEAVLTYAFGVMCQQIDTEDIGDASVIFTIYSNDDGTIRIASNNGAFWKRNSDNWISTGDGEDSKDRDTLFEVVSGDGYVALRNLGNNKFCKRLTYNGMASCLSACDDSISQYAKLKLEAPVVRREISDVKFHLDESRIYNKKIINVVSITRTNNTSRELKATFSFTKKVEMVSTWETNVSSKIGVMAKISFGGTPIIVAGEVTISTESTTSEGRTTSESNTDESKITEEYSIPPRTTLAGRFVATRAFCDVPYSYKQTDVLTTGEEVTTIYDDGIYTVANNYNFHIIVTDDEDEIRRLV